MKFVVCRVAYPGGDVFFIHRERYRCHVGEAVLATDDVTNRRLLAEALDLAGGWLPEPEDIRECGCMGRPE